MGKGLEVPPGFTLDGEIVELVRDLLSLHFTEISKWGVKISSLC